MTDIEYTIKKLITEDGISFRNVSADELEVLISQLQQARKNLISKSGIEIINKTIKRYCGFSETESYFFSDNLLELKNFIKDLRMVYEEIKDFNNEYSAETGEASLAQTVKPIVNEASSVD